MKTICVIGLGSIGMRHAKNLHDLGHKVFGYDPDTEREAEFMKYCGKSTLPATDKIFTAILDRCDAAVIASPTETHFETIAKCKGKPLFVEKPIGGRGVPSTQNVLMVGYNLRFHSCVQVAKHWLAGGHIGKPIWGNFVCAQYTAKPDYMRDGVILNWSHEIDLALYLLGTAAVNSSSTRLTNGYDDMTDICLIHQGGSRSTVHLDYLTKPEIRQGIIVGTDGTIIMDLLNRQAWVRGTAGIVMDHHVGTDTFDDNYKDEMSAFIDMLNGKPALGCTASEAMNVLSVCHVVRTEAGLF